ncbi:MAG: PIN domain-containing protein [Methylovulum miyakonense]|uniref:PIN domain-containing protein n=1 Tax=Methylovulum miyakonense TaxID=645578 RepID=UPI003BB4CCD5
MILVDTDVLIWYLKGNPVARDTINNLSGFCISVVTYMELVQGMRNKQELDELRRALKNWHVKVLYVSEDISIKALF